MKTFYSVNYKIWGSDLLFVRWFDNKEDAKKFAARDFADSPVAHNFRSTNRIAEILDIIREQKEI